MPTFLADEDFDGRIVQGLLARVSDLDLLRVQDIGLEGRVDAEILEWAARQERIVLTRDETTMTAAAYHRIQGRQPMPGLIVVPQGFPIGSAIERLVAVAGASLPGEWADAVTYIQSL